MEFLRNQRRSSGFHGGAQWAGRESVPFYWRPTVTTARSAIDSAAAALHRPADPYGTSVVSAYSMEGVITHVDELAAARQPGCSRKQRHGDVRHMVAMGIAKR